MQNSSVSVSRIAELSLAVSSEMEERTRRNFLKSRAVSGKNQHFLLQQKQQTPIRGRETSHADRRNIWTEVIVDSLLCTVVALAEAAQIYAAFVRTQK